MKKLGKFELDKVYCGDSKELMKDIPNNSIDLIVTDPPYQLSSIQKRFGKNGSAEAKWGKDGAFRRVAGGFMGKKWDVLPPIEVWKESLRVLKAGAFAFIMTTPRQDSLCQILMDLSNAGFVMGFSSIYWTYASGFPKASNIGKMADKRRIGSQFKPIREYLRESWKKSGKTQKYLKKAIGDLTTGGGRISHYFGTGIAQPSVPNWEDWCILKKELNMDDRFDYFLKEYEREITRKDKNWGKKGSTPLTGYKEFDRKDKPITSQAKSLNGSYAGFQPKPAVEVIIVTMKPLSEKTYVDQALKNKHGITWLDDCKIPYESETDIKSATRKDSGLLNKKRKGQWTENYMRVFNQKGRFPANLLVSDDVLNDGRTLRSGGRTGLKHSPEIFGNAKSNIGKTIELNPYQDSGSFSRYFDLDKWWKKKIKELPEDVQKTFPFIVCAKASKSEKNRGLENFKDNKANDFMESGAKWRVDKRSPNGGYEVKGRPTKNIHPTVKPIKLMSYLITLGSREGDIILDNFCGSGSTLISAKKLNRRFLGFDTEMEYVVISRARLSAIKQIQERLL